MYYKYRHPKTVSDICKKYSLFRENKFKEPGKSDIENNQIIISTLATAKMLLECGAQGMFTHIFIDEAGQALETQSLVPLTLATSKTCVVLAGDYHQMSPVVYSDLAKKNGFHQSLLERLLNHYFTNSHRDNHIFLTSNFRSHVNVIRFVAEIFYGGAKTLHACSRDAICWDIPALMFHDSRGFETQLENSTGFCNIDEAVLVAEKVEQLVNEWPQEWGYLNQKEIGVISAYTDQVWYFVFLKTCKS